MRCLFAAEGDCLGGAGLWRGRTFGFRATALGDDRPLLMRGRKKIFFPTLEQLRLLVLVRRHESLGAAAREIGVGRSAVARSAKELERLCNRQLFDRGIYTTYLSFTGRRLAKQAQRVLDEYDALLSLIPRKRLE
jgi:hypothetical protein